MAEGYNPTAESPLAMPYQPNQVADPKPATPSPFGGQPGYQFKPEPISHAGAIAGLMDNVLRGIVNGHAMREANKAMQLKKKSDDLNQSYNQDAQRLYQLARSGVDPKAPEYQAAQSAVNGSWGALQDFRGNLLEQQGGGKKKKDSKSKPGEQTNPLTALTDPNADPAEKAKAVYAISGKLGAPVFGQIASLNTPQAQQQRATQATQGQVESAHAGNSLTHEQAQATYDKYAGMTEEQLGKLPQAEQDKFRNARAVLAPQPKASSTAKEYTSPDGKQQNYFVPGSEPEGWNAYNRPSASAKPVRAFVKEGGKLTSVLIDPATNKKIPGSENPDIQPPSSLEGRVTSGYYHYVDSDGNLHQIAEQHSSVPISQGGGGHAAPTATPATTPAAPVTGGTTAAPTTPTRRERTPSTTQTAAPHATPAGTSTGTPGDRVLGHKGTTEEVAAKKLADTRETAFREAMGRLKNPTPIGDKGIVFDWVRSQVAGAGRMTNTEIQQAYSAGSLDQRASSTMKRFFDGTMDNGLRRQMVNDIGESARAARMQANSYAPKTSTPPPQSVIDGMKEGQYAHGPDGATWQKKNGKAVLVGAN